MGGAINDQEGLMGKSPLTLLTHIQIGSLRIGDLEGTHRGTFPQHVGLASQKEWGCQGSN